MKTYSINTENKALNEFNAFRNIYGNGDIYGLPTFDLAVEFTALKSNWFGSNLVFLGIEEKNNKFYPAFNVFD